MYESGVAGRRGRGREEEEEEEDEEDEEDEEEEDPTDQQLTGTGRKRPAIDRYRTQATSN